MKKNLLLMLCCLSLSGCGLELLDENNNHCKEGFTGTNCDQCADSRFTGTNCDQCADIRFTGANCDECAERFTGTNCDFCDDNHYGENCDKEYGSFTASDGNTYKTFVFNNHTWMAENLRYSQVDHYSANNKSTNDATYGYLYTWENAMKACPEGWRLPTKEEFESLLTTTGAGSDSSSIRDSSWSYSWSSGSNSSGFSALPAGYRGSSGYFLNFGSSALFWSSTPSGSYDAYDLGVNSSFAFVYYDYVNFAYSVRCLKDSN